MTRGQPVDERQAFTVDQGHLVRTVTRRAGGNYSHRCSLESYKAVAHFIEENASAGVTTGMLWEAVPEVPCTQASVAVAFLKERGVRGRPLPPPVPDLGLLFFEDAMVEFYALEEAQWRTKR